MELSVEQIKELIKTPANATAILDAQNHEDRIKLHTKAVDDYSKASAYFQSFLEWVKDGIRLPNDKFEVFEAMCQFPLATTGLCNSIFDEYEKIFSAQDKYFDIEMLDDTLKEELKDYIDEIKVHDYMRTKGFEEYKKQPCSIYVVDLPATQDTQRPRPFFKKISIQRVVDIAMQRIPDGTERIGYVIYTIHNGYIAYDDMSFRLFEKDDKGEPVLIIDSLHNLGYTPATFLAKASLYDEDDDSPIARKVPISDSLGDLDWLLAYKVFERMYETYGPFPIMTIPETDCRFVDAHGTPCTSGWISYIKRDGTSGHTRCPSCEKNAIVGPGTIFTKPVPRSKDDAELKNAVEFTPADVESLDYITKKIDYLEWMIYENNVGSTDQQNQKEAVNEKQVQSNVEGKRNVLFKIKRDFELTEKFIVDTIGRLMYGDYFVTSTVNYGEQFLLFTAAEITEHYAFAKKSGLPQYLVSQKKQQLIQTEYRNNPYEQQRSRILDLLEPWPDMSPTECLTYQLNLLFPEKFYLKLDFAKFVSKFELANGDIVQWGSLITLDSKITKLTQILLEYGKVEQSTAKPLPEPATSGKPVGGTK